MSKGLFDIILDEIFDSEWQGKRGELKKIQLESDDIKVIKRERTYATVREIWNKNPDALSDSQVKELYEKLKVLTNVDKAVKAAHIENIQNRYVKKPDDKTAADSSTIKGNNADNMICPRCGGTLVLRTARTGANAGNQFYGCSNFPKCRYTRSLL